MSKVILWGLMVIFMIWNFRLYYKSVKIKTQKKLRDPRNLSGSQLKEMQMLNKERRRWGVLSQIFFWVSLILVFAQSMSILIYFIDLYIFTCIIANKIDLKAAEILSDSK